MRNLKTTVLLASAVTMAGQFAMADDGGIPIVPVSVVTNTNGTPPPKIPVPSAVPSAPVSSGTDIAMNDATTIMMRRGVNEIIPVAVHHMNRIVTPFSSPVVKTVANADVSVDANVVYVATGETAPVTLFITEDGNPDVSMNLTLVPRRIPAREVFLTLEESLMMARNSVGSTKADRWERSQPYVETIRTVFRGLALGELPQGYSLARYPASRQAPNCVMDGLAFNFKNGQLLSGHNMQVSVGVVQNTSTAPIEIREAVCGGWDVTAVAAWPNNMLMPGQKSEIYVAERINRSTKSASKRPSLLGGM
jgi:conjugal transfer pilus assembly protein TraK